MVRMYTVILVLGLLAGCTSTSGRVVVEDRDKGVRVEVERDDDSYYDDRYERSSTKYKIPPGHMPPPGSCRIWYPGQPAGHQPPPGDCRDLERRVPRGAILLRN